MKRQTAADEIHNLDPMRSLYLVQNTLLFIVEIFLQYDPPRPSIPPKRARNRLPPNIVPFAFPSDFLRQTEMRYVTWIQNRVAREIDIRDWCTIANYRNVCKATNTRYIREQNFFCTYYNLKDDK